MRFLPQRVLGATPVVFASVLVAAVPANGYRFFDGRPIQDGDPIVRADGALRWNQRDFPIRFRLLENDFWPPDITLTTAEWRAIIERGMRHWNRISTAEISIVLEDEPHAADIGDPDDGINTIGFSGREFWSRTWGTAFASLRDGLELGRITGCDIEFSPFFRKNWGPRDPDELLEIVVIHELGHCLGLAHSEPNPMALWSDRRVAKSRGFLPDPTMSYSNSYGPQVTEDEVVGVSLLYPAGGFFRSRGSVEGTVRDRRSRGATFAYVLAVELGGSEARAGPGVFTGRDGRFRLDGLRPGPTMLWVHPILIVRRNAHGSLLEVADNSGTSTFDDQWRWVEVRAGGVVPVPDIVVSGDRNSSP